MDLTEWAEELEYSIVNGLGTPSLFSLATCGSPAGVGQVIKTANRIVSDAGWEVYELEAQHIETGPSLLHESGFLILRGGSEPLGPLCLFWSEPSNTWLPEVCR